MTDIKMSAAQVQERLDGSPFLASLRLKVVEVDHDAQTITMSLPMSAGLERREGTGQIHGGVIATLVDTAGDFALGMLVGTGIPTISFSVDYLRPATNTDLKAVASVRKMGRSVGTADVDVFDENGKLVAIGRGTYAIVKSPA